MLGHATDAGVDVPDVEDGPTILEALRTLAEDAPELDHLEPLRG